MSKVEIVKAETFELDPNKVYIIMFDNRVITMDDVAKASEKLHKMGIKGLSFVIKGDPSSVKIVEATTPEPTHAD